MIKARRAAARCHNAYTRRHAHNIMETGYDNLARPRLLTIKDDYDRRVMADQDVTNDPSADH